MSLSRKTQVELAKPLIAIDALTDDPKITTELNRIAATVYRIASPNDNGVAFDVSEYLHEKMERITTGAAYTYDSWEHSSNQSVMLQLSDYPDTISSTHVRY